MEESQAAVRQGPQEARHHRRSAANCRRPTTRPSTAALTATAKVLGWVKDNAVVTVGRDSSEDEEAGLLLDRTNFYAEQGGQVGDTGVIATPTGRFEVEDTQKLGDAVLHVGRVVEGASGSRTSRRRSKSAATGRTPCATTPPRTCSTGPCARCWASTSSRRARWSMPTRRASISPTTSRCRRRRSRRSSGWSTRRSTPTCR